MAHIMDEKDEDELLATFETLLELYVRSNDSNGFAPAQEVNNANGLIESFRQDEGELEWGINEKGKRRRFQGSKWKNFPGNFAIFSRTSPKTL